jgi:hypothetical protein
MGHISIIYGNIIGAPCYRDRALHRINKSVIESLPIDDKKWPRIERSMFLVPDPDLSKLYRDQVIVFGTSYKEVEQDWEEWLQKFESILMELYWISATVHLETELIGTHTYEWVYDSNQPDNFVSENPKPTSKWNFSGGPRKFY